MPIVVGPGAAGSTLDLTAIWLNVADDLDDCMAFVRAGDSLSASTTARVEVRQLMNRRRMVRTGSGGPAESESLTFEQCDRDQLAWLRDRVGVLLCYRDHVGTKWFGVYKDLPREVQTAYRDRIDVKVSLDEVTYSEAV